MKLYINGTGNISSVYAYGHSRDKTEPNDFRLAALEPDYKEILDPKLLRRMSRIIRMGVAAAMEALKDAGGKNPDAIITGTAYGCLQDTELFLGRMVEQNEELLAPTAFIQSTHNTVGAQISLMIQCRNYNNTFVHRGFSFESALIDAMLLLNEDPAQQVLVGGVDEITETSHLILKRFGIYRNGASDGEGAAFFVVGGDRDTVRVSTSIDGIKTIYKPGSSHELVRNVEEFIKEMGLDISEIDLLMTGPNQYPGADREFDALELFSGIPYWNYKNLCGEYPTSTAFALWLADQTIKGKAGRWLPRELSALQPKRILIYNNYLDIHHSLILISAC